MFAVEKEQFGSISLEKLVDTQSGDFFSCMPQHGAAIHDFVVIYRGRPLKLIQSSTSYHDHVTEGKRSFRGSKLFPFPNRIKDGRYQFGGASYKLPINFPSEGHAIHGLVLEESFEIADRRADQNKALLELVYDYDGDKPGYPFPYKLKLTYIFSGRELVCETSVLNTGTKALPLGDGWHPYFQLGGRIDDLFLKLPSDSIIGADSRMIPTGDIHHSDQFSKLTRIGEHEFDTCFKIAKERGVRAEVIIEDQERNLGINIWQEVGLGKYNFLQVYTPPARDCIAVEPMTSAPDAFNNLMGLIRLDKGEKFEARFGIQLNLL